VENTPYNTGHISGNQFYQRLSHGAPELLLTTLFYLPSPGNFYTVSGVQGKFSPSFVN
jgi:hypothetical protein